MTNLEKISELSLAIWLENVNMRQRVAVRGCRVRLPGGQRDRDDDFLLNQKNLV